MSIITFYLTFLYRCQMSKKYAGLYIFKHLWIELYLQLEIIFEDAKNV